jgi:hypothetical protein
VTYSAATTADGHFLNQCFPTADSLPIDGVTLPPTLPAGWSLRDEGRRGTGSRKLGYVSTVVGSTLRLGPIAPGVRCGMLDVHVGYLQSWTAEMGAFDVVCSGGCTCLPLTGAWTKNLYHFPHVPTASWATKTVDGDKRETYELRNASVTLFTRFFAFVDPLKKEERPPRTLAHVGKGRGGFSTWHNSSPVSFSSPSCMVEITHRRTEGTDPSAPSRIRIDSLGIELASCQLNCRLGSRGSGSGRVYANRVQNECAQSKRGYHVPPCTTMHAGRPTKSKGEPVTEPSQC